MVAPFVKCLCVPTTGSIVILLQIQATQDPELVLTLSQHWALRNQVSHLSCVTKPALREQPGVASMLTFLLFTFKTIKVLLYSLSPCIGT